ncbi:hypothetical protein GCM10020366_06850 [Saccharopolyspora gregorii]|uniref:Uncharacterized protein n=1 Tax=Saccharopolyspora gregorii TaxID=33914 RepID=A0ABP6RME1_9PSEU
MPAALLHALEVVGGHPGQLGELLAAQAAGAAPPEAAHAHVLRRGALPLFPQGGAQAVEICHGTEYARPR